MSAFLFDKTDLHVRERKMQKKKIDEVSELPMLLKVALMKSN